MIEEKAEIEFNDIVAPDTYLMGLRADTIARSAKPGQFVMIRIVQGLQPFLRRPFSICSIRDKNLILILYRVIGQGTNLMLEFERGRNLSIIGPLGNGFDMPDSTVYPLLIGGGIGVAPLTFLARDMVNDNLHFLAGFTTAKEKIPIQDILDRPVKISHSTDDGTEGFRGFITELLLDHLDKLEDRRKRIRLYACGPLKMLKKVAHIAREKEIPCQLSLEIHMACGVGACQGCAVKASAATGADYLHVCKDGPVFGVEQVEWD